MSRPSARSGVAVRPSSSTGCRCSSSASYDGAAAWWNSSTITTSKCAGSMFRTSALWRLWIDAKTCSNRDGPLPADPLLAERGVAQRVPERRTALVEDLLAMSDEQEAAAAELRSQTRVVDRCHHGLPGARGRDEQVAMVALVAGEDDVLEQRLLERPELELDRGEQRDVSAAGAPPSAARTPPASYADEVPARPVAREDRGHLRRRRPDCEPRRRGRSTPAREPGPSG